jgi:ABC-type phosphate/phosphonate transport system substrate-binding protein
MYDWPEIRWATDRWAVGLARHIREAGMAGISEDLVREADHCAAWCRSDLVLSQTCGYPLTHDFRYSLRLVATPHYGCDGCEGFRYRSIVFARGGDVDRTLGEFAGRRAAFNARDSMSGMLALKLVFAPFAGEHRFFTDAIKTGGHIASLEAVARGDADVCAIDCVTVAHARRHRPYLLDPLAEIARSPPVPALPYVTAMATSDADVDCLRRALRAATADAQLHDARAALFIDGFSDEADYDEILILERSVPTTANVDLW